jgi:hypothetical protein
MEPEAITTSLFILLWLVFLDDTLRMRRARERGMRAPRRFVPKSGALKQREWT